MWFEFTLSGTESTLSGYASTHMQEFLSDVMHRIHPLWSCIHTYAGTFERYDALHSPSLVMIHTCVGTSEHLRRNF